MNLKPFIRFYTSLLLCIIPLFGSAQWHQEEAKLCDPVEKKRWNKAGPIVGSFLDSLQYDEENGGKQGRQRRLNELKKWLEAQPCVERAELQKGTIKRRIPLKEILVVFTLNGHENPMMIRIALDAPYSFAGIYREKS